MSFPSINAALDRALLARDYLEPTPVQSAVLEDRTAGRDLLVSAQTGSGKTVAYGLAFAPTIMDGDHLPPTGPPLALIIAPTRELAVQVHAELTWLYADARIVSCVGGMDARREQRALASGCHIVVGTPGRLNDHLRRGQLDASHLRVVVLDEADEMLDLGFKEELTFILDATPPERRTMMFSATIPHDIATLARQYQRDALRIDTIDRSQAHTDIEYRAMRVAPHDIERAVVNVLRYFEPPSALVFCATREATRRLHGRLVDRGFAAVALSGELSQHDRTTALDSLRAGRARVCVCTDVAARGLDLPDLALVVHGDLPTNPETLLHRSGRTGRAGKKGVSVLIVPNPKRRRAEQILQAARVTATWGVPPNATEIRARDQERLIENPIFTEPEGEALEQARALVASLGAERVASALLRLYASRLPPPEELSEAFEPAPRDAPRDNARDNMREASIQPSGGYTQFRIGIGRRDKADPKWLIPMICRYGQVTKKHIGAIRITDGETRFEIDSGVAPAFALAVQSAPPNEPRIELADGPLPPQDYSAPRKKFVKRSDNATRPAYDRKARQRPA